MMNLRKIGGIAALVGTLYGTATAAEQASPTPTPNVDSRLENWTESQEHYYGEDPKIRYANPKNILKAIEVVKKYGKVSETNGRKMYEMFFSKISKEKPSCCINEDDGFFEAEYVDYEREERAQKRLTLHYRVVGGDFDDVGKMTISLAISHWLKATYFYDNLSNNPDPKQVNEAIESIITYPNQQR